MPNEKASIRDFKELKAWQAARKLRIAVFELARKLPAEERFVLVPQLRRAEISVTANLAEGYGRFSYQENIQFCRQSRASVYELRDHLTSVFDSGYRDQAELRAVDSMAMDVIRLVNGYIRSTVSRKTEEKHNP